MGSPHAAAAVVVGVGMAGSSGLALAHEPASDVAVPARPVDRVQQVDEWEGETANPRLEEPGQICQQSIPESYLCSQGIVLGGADITDVEARHPDFWATLSPVQQRAMREYAESERRSRAYQERLERERPGGPMPRPTVDEDGRRIIYLFDSSGEPTPEGRELMGRG